MLKSKKREKKGKRKEEIIVLPYKAVRRLNGHYQNHDSLSTRCSVKTRKRFGIVPVFRGFAAYVKVRPTPCFPSFRATWVRE